MSIFSPTATGEPAATGRPATTGGQKPPGGQTGQEDPDPPDVYARSGRCEVMSVISPVSRTSPEPEGARKWLPALTACSTPDPPQTLPEPSITERHMNGHGCASVFSPETRTRSTSKLGRP